MQHDKNKLAISAAKLYYQSGFSQAEIAKELAAVPSVGIALLQYAKDMGFVRIEIFDPIEDQGQLAQKDRRRLRPARCLHRQRPYRRRRRGQEIHRPARRCLYQ